MPPFPLARNRHRNRRELDTLRAGALNDQHAQFAPHHVVGHGVDGNEKSILIKPVGGGRARAKV